MVYKHKRINIKTIELVLLPSGRRSFIAITPRTRRAIGHSPVEKGTDVPASQTSPSMKDPTVKVLASDALVITR